MFSPNLGSESTLAIMSRLSPMDILSVTIWNIGATFLPTRAVGVAISSLAKKYTWTKDEDRMLRIGRRGNLMISPPFPISFYAYKLSFGNNSLYLSTSMSD